MPFWPTATHSSFSLSESLYGQFCESTAWRQIMVSSAMRATMVSDRPVVPAIYLPYTTLMRQHVQSVLGPYQGDPLTCTPSGAAVASVASDQQISNSASAFNGTFTSVRPSSATHSTAASGSSPFSSASFGPWLGLCAGRYLQRRRVQRRAAHDGVVCVWPSARRARACGAAACCAGQRGRSPAWSSVLPLTAFSAPSSPTTQSGFAGG